MLSGVTPASALISMATGDGIILSPLVSLDVAGHEMTHGVTSANRGSYLQRGNPEVLMKQCPIYLGLWWNSMLFPTAATTIPDYLIGEDVWTPGKTR